ncbi:MAG: hypothetical protein LUI08_00025 [Prevotella sp.]|nr:hypothetical protein [Prevotella sp.]
MKKVLLSLVALFALGMTAYATDDISLPLSSDDDLGSGWSSSYDASTQTISFEDTWCGRGWWLGEADYSDYAGVQVVIKTAADSYINLITQYNYYAEGATDAESTTGSITGSGNADEEQTIYCEFDSEMKNSVKQIYIQNATADDITIVSATVIANENADEEVDTSYTIDITADYSDWSSGTTGTVNADGTVDATFPDEWTSIGWTNWYPGWDISEYDAVVLTYENLSSTTGTAYLQLFVGDGTDAYNSATVAGTTAESGTIEFVIADHEGIDYTDIAQVFVQASEACTATIVSIKFVKYGSSEGGESVDASDYFVSLDFEGDNQYWELYDNAAFEISNDTNVTPGMDGYHFLANYGNNFYASTDLIHQTSQSELPAGTYTVSARINVGGNMDDIEFYATAGETDEYLSMAYDSADWTAEDRVSVEITLDEAAYLTIGIRTGDSYPTAEWLWLIADNFDVEAAAGEETGITSVPAVTAAGNGAIYNIAGQRVNENAKGLLIKDGKKVLVK